MIDAGRTRVIAALSAAGSVAVAGALLLSPWRSHVAMPGGLSSNHAALVDDCAACHAQALDAVQGVLHGVRATAMDEQQSARCVACHAFEHPARPHGWSPAEQPLAGFLGVASRPLPGGGSNTQCATCHHEHGNRSSDLTVLDDDRCQVCHAERFDGFAGHAPFESYPQAGKTNLGFDHVAHLLRHFPEDRSGRAPAACTSCHVLDPSGRHMPVRSYEATCAACHAIDITGPSQVEGAGIAVLSLPALDTLTLAQRGVGIGRWPADSRITEAPLTPFLALLLSADGESGLAALEDVDLLDLSAADEDTLEAVARLAWRVKGLYARIAERGHAAIHARVTALRGDARAPRADDLLHRLPEDLVQRALASWLPELTQELARHAAGEEVPTDSTTKDEEPDLARDTRHERWVETGGWYLSELDFVIRYRPAGHADGFLRSWSDLSGGIGRRGRPLFDALSAPDAVGRCGKCHAQLPSGVEGLELRWKGATGGNGQSGLDRFSHVAHFASPADNACMQCHVLDRDAGDFLPAFLQRDPLVYRPSFEHMTKATCAECHADGGVNASCLTCHVYHAQSGERRLPRASLEAVR